MLRLQLARLPIRTRQFHSVHTISRRASQLAIARHHRHLVLLHQKLKALGVFVHDHRFALQHVLPIQHRRRHVIDSVFRRILQVIPYLRVKQQRLRRNAAHMQTRPAQHAVLLNQRHFQPELPAANRRRISRRPAPNNRHIINRVLDRLCHHKLHSGALSIVRRPCLYIVSLNRGRVITARDTELRYDAGRQARRLECSALSS